jgi:hypothetical protein
MAKTNSHSTTARTWLATYADGHTVGFSAADATDAHRRATHDTVPDGHGGTRVVTIPAPTNLRPQF